MSINLTKTSPMLSGGRIPSGYLPVRENMNTNLYGVPLVEEMALAYELQLDRVQELMSFYQGRSANAARAVEAFVTKSASFIAPSAFTTPEDQNKAQIVSEVLNAVANTSGIPMPRVNEMIHGLNDFPTLVMGLIQRQFIQLSTSGVIVDNCFDPIFQDVGTVEYCEKVKSYGIVPVHTGHDDKCSGKGPLCSCVRTWKFGEIEKGAMQNFVFGDKIGWEWELLKCAPLGGWQPEVFSWLNRIIQERLNNAKITMFVDEDGLRPAVFNVANDNILENSAGDCNPAVSCTPEALDVLETFAQRMTQKKDCFGQYVPVRPHRIITNDWSVYCAFTRALNGTITEIAVREAGDCISEIEITSDACLPPIESVCYSHDLREIYGEEPIYLIAPLADGSGKNVAKVAQIEGFQTPQFMQRASTWYDLSNRALREYGNTDCFDTEMMILSGISLGLYQEELIYGSDSSGVCPA